MVMDARALAFGCCYVRLRCEITGPHHARIWVYTTAATLSQIATALTVCDRDSNSCKIPQLLAIAGWPQVVSL